MVPSPREAAGWPDAGMPARVGARWRHAATVATVARELDVMDERASLGSLGSLGGLGAGGGGRGPAGAGRPPGLRGTPLAGG
jgi:hypothetical protein